MAGQPRRVFPIGLKQILLGVGAGIFLCCAVIVVHFLGASQQARRIAQAEWKSLTRYEVALRTVQAISDEQDVSGSTMTGAPAGTASLRQRRAATDESLTELRRTFQPELARGGPYFAQFALLKASLRSARHAVDKAMLSSEPQKSRATAAAIHALFHSIDTALTLRNGLGNTIPDDAQHLSAAILLLNEADALREMTKRLGFHTAMMLTGSDREDERAKMDAVQVKLDLFWQDLQFHAPAHLKAPQVRAAVERTNRAYFLGSLPYLAKVRRLYENGEATPVGEFARRYSVGLDASRTLRDEIIRATIESANGRAVAAGRTLLTGVMSVGMICLLLLGLTLAAHRLLFKPLLSARDQILALANDNLQPGQASASASREMEEIFDSIGVLRWQLLERKQMALEQTRLTETLRFLSERDPLTHLLNRRTMEDLALVRMRDADTNHAPLAVLIVDLDHFKRVNDTYGHAVGDMVLKATAEEMRRTLRSTDILARIGGEEFLVILNASDDAQATEIAERLRCNIAGIDIGHEPPVIVTASIGLCLRRPSDPARWDEVVATADRRLYRAKAAGRNRICANDDDNSAALPIDRRPHQSRLQQAQQSRSHR